MNYDAAEKIANAVLYEGYMLYPYRPSALKNRQRWSFGTLYPKRFQEVMDGTERSSLHAECLIRGGTPAGELGIRVRFLQFGVREVPQSWDEAVERALAFTMSLDGSTPRQSFHFPGALGSIEGSVHLSVEQLGNNLRKICLDLVNESNAEASTREQALLHAMASAHLLLCLESGKFLSLLDPPNEAREFSAACANAGCFPVLVGNENQRNMMLCSPIILYDYPQVAPESAGDFFDGTEMDEMLTLRVTTMTDDEKKEMRMANDRTRLLLERTEQTAREQLIRTHGIIRSMRAVTDHE